MLTATAAELMSVDVKNFLPNGLDFRICGGRIDRVLKCSTVII